MSILDWILGSAKAPKQGQATQHMGGVGLGGLMAGSFLSTIAGTVIGSMIAQQFFSHEIGLDADGVDSGHPSGLDENQDAGAMWLTMRVKWMPTTSATCEVTRSAATLDQRADPASSGMGDI